MSDCDDDGDEDADGDGGEELDDEPAFLSGVTCKPRASRALLASDV